MASDHDLLRHNLCPESINSIEESSQFYISTVCVTGNLPHHSVGVTVHGIRTVHDGCTNNASAYIDRLVGNFAHKLLQFPNMLPDFPLHAHLRSFSCLSRSSERYIVFDIAIFFSLTVPCEKSTKT